MSSKDQIAGVVLCDHEIEWTVLRRKKGVYGVQDHQRVGLESRPDEAWSPEEWATRIKSTCGSLRGHTCLGMNSDQVLLRVADLPSGDPEELGGMVELQVDKFSPFPIEHMVISYEVLSSGENSVRVLIAATRTEAVEALGERFSLAGRRLERIDLKIMGWWTLIREQGDVPRKGRHALMLIDRGACELIVCQDGVPVVIRHLGDAGDLEDDAFIMELAEETGYTLTSLESEWGAVETPRMTLWHDGDGPPEKIMEAVRRECAVEVDIRSLDDLSPVSEGIARRCAEGKSRLDLTPREWHEAEHLKTANRRFAATVASILGVWLLGTALFLGSLHLLHRQMEQLQEDVRALEEPAERVRELRSRVESLEQYADRTYSALECLREVSDRMPSGVDLSSFVYRKGRSINLRGEANTVTPIYDFFDAMEASELFYEVKPEGITQAAGGRRRPEFRLTIALPGEAP